MQNNKLALRVFISLFINLVATVTQAQPRCELDPCHGYDVTCKLYTEPPMCTKHYTPEDRCRHFVSCENTNNSAARCKLVAQPEFERCKFCVSDCLKKPRTGPFDQTTYPNCFDKCMEAKGRRDLFGY